MSNIVTNSLSPLLQMLIKRSDEQDKLAAIVFLDHTFGVQRHTHSTKVSRYYIHTIIDTIHTIIDTIHTTIDTLSTMQHVVFISFPSFLVF